MGLRSSFGSISSIIGRGATRSKTRSYLSQKEVILREFEKKEALIEKRREEAMAKLNKYEESLQKLRETKSRYLAADQVSMACLVCALFLILVV